ncbi:MAG: thiol-disulfide oxidoreductase DCC family protein [Gammaproteobacteria bacterium]
MPAPPFAGLLWLGHLIAGQCSRGSRPETLRLYNRTVTERAKKQETGDIILFDGMCHLCLGSVRFLFRHDKKARYRFAWLQSPAAGRLLSDIALPATDSVVLVQRGQFFFRSTAILKALTGLGGLWKLAAVLLVIPATLRDAVYDFVGARRYRWFGKSAQCDLPLPSASDRFLVDGLQLETPSPRNSDANTLRN